MSVVIRRRWLTAWRGLRRLGRDYGDTGAVMDIIQGLEGPSIWEAFAKMKASPAGREQLLWRKEFVEVASDKAWLATFAPGTVGAAYRDFLARHGISGRVLADHLLAGPNGAMVRRANAVAWTARRICDLHDVLHVLTGYDADPRGEGCLMAFTFARSSARSATAR